MSVLLILLVLLELSHIDLWWFHHLTELNEEFVDSLQDWLEVWEHQDHWVSVLELLIKLLNRISHLLVESGLLDVLSLDRLVPLVVESGDSSGEFSHIRVESVELGHLLHVGVAGVILGGELEEVEGASEDLEEVVEESLLKVLEEDALSWVLDAPGLGVITDSLELADIGVLVDGVEEEGTGGLDLLEGDGPEVLMHSVLEVVHGVEG